MNDDVVKPGDRPPWLLRDRNPNPKNDTPLYQVREIPAMFGDGFYVQEEYHRRTPKGWVRYWGKDYFSRLSEEDYRKKGWRPTIAEALQANMERLVYDLRQAQHEARGAQVRERRVAETLAVAGDFKREVLQKLEKGEGPA